MKQVIIILLLLLMSTSLMGCKRKEISDKTFNDFITKLEDKGYKVDAKDVDRDILAGKRKWLILNDTYNITIYLYESGEKMEEDASYIDKWGSGYNNGKTAINISWVSLPHFYKKDNMIVLYVGENTKIIAVIEEIVGEQFAGYKEMNN